MRFRFMGGLTLCFLGFILFFGEQLVPITLNSSNSRDSTKEIITKSPQNSDQQEYEAAIEQNQKLIEQTPDNVDYLFQAGMLNKKMGRKQKALEYYLKALAIQPDNPDINVQLGFVYLADRNLEDSEKSFLKALEVFPNYADALAGLGRISALDKKFVEAEEFYLKALKIAPDNTTALEYLAALLTQQKRYQEANELYQKLLYPDSNPAEYKKKEEDTTQKEKLLSKSVNSTESILKKTAQYIDQHNYEAALEEYEQLLKDSPDNFEFLFQAGMLNKKMDRRQKALEYYLKALAIQPDNPDINVQMGFAYLADGNLLDSERSFHKALERYPDYADALAGMGRISAINKDPWVAEQFYSKALQLEPNNMNALEYLAALRTQQKRYQEANALYQKLTYLDPNNSEYKKTIDSIQNKQTLSEYEENGFYIEAENLCKRLIAVSPEVDIYLELGKIYNHQGMRFEAIEIYYEALQYQPTNTDVLNALAYTYLKLGQEEERDGSRIAHFNTIFSDMFVRDNRNLNTSEMFFQRVLEQHCSNIEALAGLGAIATAKDYLTEAEDYFSLALSIDPADTNTLTYLALLRTKQKKYFSARDIYRYLLCIDSTDEDARVNLADNKFSTSPNVTLAGFYDEENEKINSIDKWVARLKNYGGILKAVYPVNDCLKLSGALVNEYIDLKQLVNRTNIYSLGIQRAFINATWKNGNYLTTYGGVGISNYGKHLKATFRTKHGIIFQPNLGFTYNKRHHNAILETNGDAVIVDRNFNRNTAQLIERQFLRGFYEHDFGRKVLAGAEAANIWYFDKLHNQEQRAALWLQLTPPKYSNNISLRYLINYRTFKDLTLSYYTYRNQVTNWLQLDLYKEWENKTFVHVKYSHGWQRSYETGEIITITPSPFHWLSRRIDTVFAEVGTRVANWDFLLQGYYYHDNFEYTVGSVTGSISFTF